LVVVVVFQTSHSLAFQIAYVFEVPVSVDVGVMTDSLAELAKARLLTTGDVGVVNAFVDVPAVMPTVPAPAVAVQTPLIADKTRSEPVVFWIAQGVLVADAIVIATRPGTFPATLPLNVEVPATES
jgi:hypothetical protein